MKGSDPLIIRGLAGSESPTLKGTVPLSVVVVDDGSRDGGAVAAVARAYGARLVRRERSGGPGVARNDGLREVETEFVAFLDSDTVPPPGWIDALAGHFDDPRVAAVAPRVRALGGGRSPLDMGPGRKVAYVPSAALVVRREALPVDPFDAGAALRGGRGSDLAAAGRRVAGSLRTGCGRVPRGARPGQAAVPVRDVGGAARAAPSRARRAHRRCGRGRRPRSCCSPRAGRGPRRSPTPRRRSCSLERCAHKGVPVRLAPLWTARSLAQSVTQFARLATPYGAGVLYGCVKERTFRSILP